MKKGFVVRRFAAPQTLLCLFSRKIFEKILFAITPVEKADFFIPEVNDV